MKGKAAQTELRHIDAYAAELPSCDFFPRRDYAVASFSSGDGFVVLGGSAGHVQLNDLWSAKLLGRGAAATWHWTEVSPHLDGRRDPMDGQLLLSKWPGRSRLATAVALAPKSSNARAIYVTGGQGAYCFEDFWASEDGGQTWYCMCRKVPWGGRLDPGLCVVPTKYEQLVLLGGIVPGIHLRVECDVWISSDAGSTWQPLRAPDWEPRCCPLLFFMPPQDGQRQLLVLGGARLAEASAGDRAHAIGPRCLDDAWSLQVDFDEGTGTFEPLHSDVDREVEVSSDSTHSAVK
ncbi:Potassium/sodium hyperpolarization-activated cyclic nucleotide-gated channel 2 [Durusdinium trenchii]|uniref:Potassium/sodium hyperpolarization-activated cyclic nucleotide-gated channel 2 n=1 Tax=Durusdinium trenchii TaxID=1381693 RepID=A0ABP0N3Y0_9DINO